MPSRNKRNRNRAQTQATSGANSSKNETTAVKISDDSVGQSKGAQVQESICLTDSKLEQSKQDESKPEVANVQEKSDQLEHISEVANAVANTVDNFELTKSDQIAAENVENKLQFETQPSKKKRNRNRNRKKQSPNADESSTSTSGTHENSPTFTIQTVLPATEVITSAITEEPGRVDATNNGDSEEKPIVDIETTKDDENDVKICDEGKTDEVKVEIQSLHEKVDEIIIENNESSTPLDESLASIEEISAPIEAPVSVETPTSIETLEPIESLTLIDETPVIIDASIAVNEQEPEKTDEFPIIEPITSDHNEQTSSDDNATAELEIEPIQSEQKPVQETEKISNENEKQKRSRQPKNKNKNKKETNSLAAVQSRKNDDQDKNSNNVSDQSHQGEKTEEKSMVSQTDKVDLETESDAKDVEKLHEIIETDPSIVIDTDARQQLAENRIDQDETKIDQSKVEKEAPTAADSDDVSTNIDGATNLQTDEIPMSIAAVDVEGISDTSVAIISSAIDSTQTENKQAEKVADKSSKPNEKHKKSRNAKNGNKNQAKQFESNVSVDNMPTKKIDQNEGMPNDHLLKVHENQAKNATIEVNTLDLEIEIDSKSPLDVENAGQKTETNVDKPQNESALIEEKIDAKIESNDMTSDENKVIDSGDTSNDNFNDASNEEAAQIEFSSTELEKPMQNEENESSQVAESEINLMKPDEIKPSEIKHECAAPPEEKQLKPHEKKLKEQTLETKAPVTPPNLTPKQNKKSKGKKSRGENGKEQRNDRLKDSSSDETSESGSKSPSPGVKQKETIAIASSEIDLIKQPTEAPAANEEQQIKNEQIEDRQPEIEKLPEKSAEISESDLITGNTGLPTDSKAPDIEPAPNELKSTEISASTSDVQIKDGTEMKKSESSAASPNQGIRTPSSTPILATPAAEPKKPVKNEDETAKIWKILEEASKSLEPVEIQMDVDLDDGTPILDKMQIDMAAPINACSSKDAQQIKEEAQNLAKLLDTKESTKPKTNAPAKAPKAKENNQKPKQNSPTKTIAVQPPKANEPKKNGKSPPKNLKPNKPNQSKQTTPEKAVETSPDKTPPSEEKHETISLDDDEIPLDVSILPNETELSELNEDSKNVHGSDFVPFVEQSTNETKSLPFDNVSVKPTDFVKQCDKIATAKGRDAKSKSKSPINANSVGKNGKMEKNGRVEKTGNSVKKLHKTNGKQQEMDKSTPNDTLVVIEENNNQVGKNIASEAKAQSKTKSVKSDPSSTVTQMKISRNPAQTEANTQTAQVKPAQSTRKPTIPPKPDHLMRTQAKRTQATAAKSNRPANVLVLAAPNFDDEDSEEDYIEYKFSPRQVFIATICQLCKKPTKSADRILCQLCQMVSYCSAEHVTNDELLHKDLCSALQEIANKRGGHIYNNARILNNNDYRSLRVHTLNLCENFVKRPLQTFEREILLFPRLCSTPTCREWRQNLLSDCENCRQVYFCSTQPDHLVETHKDWCKSVALYQKLVVRQSVSGRIEPSLPSRIQIKPYSLPNSIDQVFKDLYRNFSVIRDDCVFSTLTQLATAPLTAFFATQKAEKLIGEKFVIHLIGAELQFEADVLDIWETFFLHLAHNLMELTIVFCGPELNAENIPLDIISRIRMCRTCRQNCRIVKFDFQCAKFYHDYAKSSSYTQPDLICFFNPGFHHINSLSGLDTWSPTIKIAANLDCPIVVTSYTAYESPRDLERFQNESANAERKRNVIFGPEANLYASQRPERNFISDEMVPLIFKNYYCFILK